MAPLRKFQWDILLLLLVVVMTHIRVCVSIPQPAGAGVVGAGAVGAGERVPVITDISPDRIIPLGSNTTLKCEVTGVASSYITWKLIKDSSREEVVGSGPTYDVINVSASSAGLYVCEVSNSIAAKRADVIVSIQEFPPTVVKAPRNTSANIGDYVTMTCDVTGYPAPETFWEHIDEDGKKKLVMHGDVLSIAIDDVGSAGTYVCIARNSLGNVTASAYVTLLDSQPVIRNTSQTQSLTPGSNATLTCDVIGVPPPSVFWTFHRNGSLHTTLGTGPSYDVINMDEAKAGMYVCHAHNSAGNTSGDVEVRLKDVPPKINMLQSNLLLRPGTSVTLTCPASGYPAPTVAWGHLDSTNFPDDVTSLPGASIDSNGTLHLTHVTNQAAGYFVCKATNRAGRDTVSIHVTVSADDKPE